MINAIILLCIFAPTEVLADYKLNYRRNYEHNYNFVTKIGTNPGIVTKVDSETGVVSKIDLDKKTITTFDPKTEISTDKSTVSHTPSTPYSMPIPLFKLQNFRGYNSIDLLFIQDGIYDLYDDNSYQHEKYDTPRYENSYQREKYNSQTSYNSYQREKHKDSPGYDNSYQVEKHNSPMFYNSYQREKYKEDSPFQIYYYNPNRKAGK